MIFGKCRVISASWQNEQDSYHLALGLIQILLKLSMIRKYIAKCNAALPTSGRYASMESSNVMQSAVTQRRIKHS
jgi:hypothetical protein